MKLKIPIDVIPQGRPRFYHGIAVDPPKSRQFKKDLALMVKSLHESAFYVDELSLKIDVYRNKKSVTSRLYGDIDNLAKAILDALTGVLWSDDSQISELHITKNISDKPRLEIEIDATQKRG